MAVLVAAAVLLGACGDTAEPREFIEPVPFDPVTDLINTTIPGTLTIEVPPTTVDVEAEAAAWFDHLVAIYAVDDVPVEAWADFARAGCEEGIWDRGVNFALAEDFSILPFESIEAIASNQRLVAELLWWRSVELCGEEFPSGGVDRGPPLLYEFPRCRHPLELWALPWSSQVTEADTGQDHSLGLTFSTWFDGDDTLEIIQGADPSFDVAFRSGTSIGEINGDPAVSFADAERVMVMWRTSEWHCGAFRIEFHPVPETDDLAAFIEELLTPPDNFFTNLTAGRMVAATSLIDGYTTLPGLSVSTEDSAQMVFENESQVFEVLAIPIEFADADPPPISDTIEVAGVTFELFYDDQGSLIVTRGVSFPTDGYLITIRTAPGDEQLMDFALEFRRAWLAAGPPGFGDDS